MRRIFITGIGTDVGKTFVAGILAEALEADYWKPVQAGFDNGTDSEWIKSNLSNPVSKVHPETYIFRMAASPHIAAREEGKTIDLDIILNDFNLLQQNNNKTLIIEGAGGLMVPLNEKEFVLDLVKKLGAGVIIVSRNYLGSINHSLLTAAVCKSNNIPVFGWIFNDQYLNYENEIEKWSGIPRIVSIPLLDRVEKETIVEQARLIRSRLTMISDT